MVGIGTSWSLPRRTLGAGLRASRPAELRLGLQRLSRAPGARRPARADGHVGREEAYDLGDGYNHFALTVDDLDAVLAKLDSDLGVEPEKPAYRPGDRDDLPRIAFVADPDGYRIELIDGGAFPTPQDGPHPSTT